MRRFRSVNDLRGIRAKQSRARVGALGWALIAMSLLCATAANPALARPLLTPEYLESFDGQKRAVALPNGETLAYLDIGRHDGTPVVLIHGYTDSARDWAPVAPLLAPAFHLIIVDLRGHGTSSKPDCCYTRFDFAYDIKLLLDRLHIERADVVGHSLGSLVAQTFAELWPEITGRLVLISSTGTGFGTHTPSASHSSGPPGVPGWLLGVWQLNDPIDPDSVFMRDWWHESARINPEFFSARQRRDAAAIPAHVWLAIADQSLLGVDLASMLPRVRAPTLLIWGERDTLMDAAGRDSLRKGISQAEVRIFPTLGHDLIWEEPDTLAKVLTAFLREGE
jgi:pimeloyl-ACP methyl ester carboxylesterase